MFSDLLKKLADASFYGMPSSCRLNTSRKGVLLKDLHCKRSHSKLDILVFVVQVQQYPMGDFESKLNERGKMFQHRANMDGCLRSYLSSPVFYMLSVGRARQMVETHCQPEEPLKVRLRYSCEVQRRREATTNESGQTKNPKLKRIFGNIDYLCA